MLGFTAHTNLALPCLEHSQSHNTKLTACRCSGGPGHEPSGGWPPASPTSHGSPPPPASSEVKGAGSGAHSLRTLLAPPPPPGWSARSPGAYPRG